jgi:glycosyltransferase involved in cell wall biosynthesis
MKILLVHPVLLPPRDYGGIERVVLWLAKGLAETGHQVCVAAAPGSQLPPGCELLEVGSGYTLMDWLRILPSGLDVMHFMAPVSSEIWAGLPVPALLTVHGNGQLGEAFPKNSVFLSQNHAQRHGATVFVYNGIDPSEYLFQPDKKSDWNLFLSKTSWSVKNLRGAIRYSQLAGQSLKIAGGNRPYLSRLRCLFSSGLDWVGPVAGKQKAQLLAQARALLFPVRWPEPFGLVIAEALVSGTPVIGNPQGSLLEMIPSTVGVLPADDQQWVDLLRQASTPLRPPEVCRAWALEKFHYLKMAENYVAIYQRVLQGKFLHEVSPVTQQTLENESWR